MHSLTDAVASLRQHFGFEDFREGQREVIGSILEGKDAVVVMPTGSGKSLCYQLPAMILDGVTLVVSPLIALMKDQVDALQARGLPAPFINSSISESEQRARIDALRRREHKLVYIAPERFRSSRFNAALQQIPISLFAVDEAHCISTWGHDFRPDYLRLRNVIKSLNGVQTLALTATATPYVRSDIVQQLGLNRPQTFVSGFDRPNLSIEVFHTERVRQKITRIRNLAKEINGSGIIYASTRKAVEDVGAKLKAVDLKVSEYHAGMSDAMRVRAQDDFMSGRTQMIVATNAFGMGIDKPDIRFVVHYQMPGSLEAYYQESGRAGRDGEPAMCSLFYRLDDRRTQQFFLGGKHPKFNDILAVYQALEMLNAPVALAVVQEHANTVSAGKVRVVLSLLKEFKVVRELRGSQFRLLTVDVKERELEVLSRMSEEKVNKDREKLERMMQYGQSAMCRWRLLHDYFGEAIEAERCGNCDNCIHPLEEQIALPDRQRAAASTV